ncbi:N-methyl-L-tryptophan oxidase [Oryzifoliimicrobium ureilyticus]|uniref:N-methyl-L-tryptophan oxidase n=1 Tax=Oryzifoliimicrobium ureilyticus TaxID=3113724 RepID=UPI0030765A69
MTIEYDVAIVGLGAMGSAAAAFLAARGARVLGIETHFPAHALSSSHGDSRLIRLGYFEDPSYVPLLQRAYQNWRAWEAALRTDLLFVAGVLQIGKADSKIVSGTEASCKLHGLPYERLDKTETERRFPAFKLDEGEVAVLDPQGGYLKPEAAVMGALKIAAAHGAELHFGERVTALEPDARGVSIVSSTARYRARKIIVATGAWVADLVPALRPYAMPIRQVVAWYQPQDGFVAQVGRMPCFLRDEGNGGSYFGFPALGADGVKIGRHAHFMEPIDPEKPNPPVNEKDRALLDDFAVRRLLGVASHRVRETTCRYTMLPSEDFLIDFLPGHDNVVISSACSGHGFKFMSVVGEILADLALIGETQLPRSLFSFHRHFGA